MTGHYVKALFDFPSTETGDLPFLENDIVQVVYDVDDNWACGKLYGRVGNFPRSFIQPIELPHVSPGQKVFAAIKEFISEVDGDLCFVRGDVITGVQQVDQNWWQGVCGGRGGIFPVTHVQELDVAAVSTQPIKSSDHVVPQPISTQKQPEIGVVAKGRANMDLTAQLDDELSFYNGDIIDITEIVDSDFAVGSCRGKSGSFPLAFVDVIEGSVEPVQKEEKRHSKFDWWKDVKSDGIEENVYEEIDVGEQTASPNLPSNAQVETPVITYTLPPLPLDTHPQLNTSDSHALSVIRETQGPPMPSTVPISIDNSPKSHKRNGSYNQQNTYSQGDGGITPYGKTLFPFVGENPNELTVFDNEIVTLIRHVDDQWIEGEIDGKQGIFPLSYVEIIVDCPYDYETSNQGNFTKDSVPIQQTTKEPLEMFPVDTFGCVLYDFIAEVSGDLNLEEGDTIRLLSRIDDEWYEGMTDNGAVGMCPVSYIEIIPAEPPTITATPAVKNGYKDTSLDEAIITNNNIVKTPDLKASPPEKPNRLPKPAILGPKPTVKPKPQLKPQPISPVEGGVSGFGRSLSVDSSEKIKPPAKPPRPGPAPQKQMSLSTSLDDFIQKELNHTKKELGTIVEPQPLPHNRTLSNESNAEKSPGYVEMESSTLSVSFSKSNASPATQRSPVPSRPPPIPDTNRLSGPPKRTPPPRPHTHPTPQSLPLEPMGAGFGPRPVPQRAAPPRPSGGPVPAPRRKRSGDLMEFSPEEVEMPVFGEDRTEENMEVIQDLESRIAEASKDLQNYEEEKAAVEIDLASSTDSVERSELQENIDFYAANITGLTEELTQLKVVLLDLQPEKALAEEEARRQQEADRLTQEERRLQQEALKQKHRATREKVIAEILQTEKDYLHGLNLCFESFFHTDAFKCPGVDAEALLGNMDEVSEVSQRLLNALESATNGIAPDEQIIGKCFMDLREDMKRVYAPYCRNHDEVIALLAKYEKEPEIQACFNQMLDVMRKQMSVFDLGSVLIKPVQRILKYPLLLNELVKCTEDDHPDKEYLVKGILAMTDVAAIINEYKRRKDLVLKYKNTTDVKFSEKMAKLNMHSTKKKFQRLSQKMVGIQTVDDNFNREERKFKNLESALRVMVRDISNYVENAQATCQAQELLAHDISDYYSDKNTMQDIHQFCKVHSEISNSIHYRFKEEVECRAITPLNRLLTMFQGPIKVIKKRHDKLLDYDNLSSRVKNIRDQEQLRSEKESLQSAKNNYEALNAQLLDELPTLHTLSLEVIHECVGYMVQAQRDYYNKCLEQMYHMLGLQLVLGHDVSNIIETFNIAHTTAVDQLSDVCFIPKSFNPRIEEKKMTLRGRKSSEIKGSANTENLCSSQSDSQRAYLRQHYTPDKLYKVTQSVGGAQDMDLELAQGIMVGVIKEGDPMGNKEHWFVDTGATKGFIMKHFLSPAKGGGTVGLPPEVVVPQGAAAAPSENLLDLISLMPEKSPSSSPFGEVGLSFEQEFDQYFEESQSEPSSQDVVANSNLSDTATNAGRSRSGSELPEQDDVHAYQAVYPFTSRTPLEVDLLDGERVHVIDFHDQDGNNEWWLVECAGKQGYAPANYLYKVQ